MAEHEVSQGWGGGPDGNLDLRHHGFAESTRQHYKLVSTRVPTNLKRIRNFGDGDLLVMPHVPEYGRVSLHVVDGSYPDCYRYDPLDETHQNHRIAVRRSFGLEGQISIRYVALAEYHAKLRWLRLPVLPIGQFTPQFEEIIAEIDNNENAVFQAAELDDYFARVAGELENLVTQRIRTMPASGGPISFERLCERVLVESGYNVEERNQYDGRGGDVDLVCTRIRRDASIFEDGVVTLFVQVKKHDGTTGANGVRQLIAMQRNHPNADGCVMSSGDAFTNTARELADVHGIVLLDRRDICQLLFPLLSQQLVVAP